MRVSAQNLAVARKIVLVLIVVLAPSAQSQTFQVIYNFTGARDGSYPHAGLSMDRAGDLYGTTVDGGAYGLGMVFKLSRGRSSWVLSPLHSFAGGSDGGNPYARVVFGPDGSLYGTTNAAGNSGCYQGVGCGTVIRLSPPPRACTTVLCPWTETVLHHFTGGTDGGNSSGADLTFDRLGNLYGTTVYGGLQGCGGAYGCGIVYKLTLSNGGWRQSVLYRFTGGNDGGNPGGGVVFDQTGNLYGVTTQFGPSGQGTVYELTPTGTSWKENTLFDFQGEYGTGAVGSLVFDGYGNLFGATTWDNFDYPWYPGTLYEIEKSNHGWELSYHYDLGYQYPQGGVTMDAAGNLYGTAAGNAELGIYGAVYKVAPSNGSWDLVYLHAFSDGSDPGCSVVVDASGNIYGTTENGGAYGYGAVWQITP
jgi:uncharacterized repeat protein (TIGR03803 family)